MRVLLLNGSPRSGGNTAVALAEMEKVFHEEGIRDRGSPGGEQGHPGLRGLRLLR